VMWARFLGNRGRDCKERSANDDNSTHQMNEFNTQDPDGPKLRAQKRKESYFADQAMPSTPGVKSIVGWSCQVRRSSTAIFPAGIQVT
jgi:hypothetical protein